MRLTALIGTLLFAAVFSVAFSPSVHAASQNTNAKISATVVKVQPGDTLSRIAKPHGTTYQRLFNANKHIAHPDVIYVGSDVRIPHPDEQLTQRILPGAAVPAQAAAAPTPRQQYAAPQPVQYVAPASQPVQPAPAPVSTSNAGVWDRLAQCESGGNWSTNTGNGYYGGLQFSQSSWQAVGGSGLPSQASKAEQIARAEKLQAVQGWGAWPACTAKLGIG